MTMLKLQRNSTSCTVKLVQHLSCVKYVQKMIKISELNHVVIWCVIAVWTIGKRLVEMAVLSVVKKLRISRGLLWIHLCHYQSLKKTWQSSLMIVIQKKMMSLRCVYNPLNIYSLQKKFIRMLSVSFIIRILILTSRELILPALTVTVRLTAD